MAEAWSNQLVDLIILAAQQAGFSGFFVYSPAPGAGNLIVSITGAAGTDPYGDAYPGPGLAVGKAATTQLFLTSAGGVGELLFLLNNALFGNGVLAASVLAGFGQIFLNGPKLLSVPDFVGEELNSNNGQAGGGANWTLVYNDSGGTAHTVAGGSFNGFQIPAGQIAAVQPGTGTSAANAAFPETWHPGALINNWGGSGSGVNGIWYRLLPLGPSGTVEIMADLLNSTATGNSTCFTLPAGYTPATSQNHPAGWNNPQASNSATVPWVNVATNGNVQVTGIQVANKEIFFHILVPLETL